LKKEAHIPKHPISDHFTPTVVFVGGFAIMVDLYLVLHMWQPDGMENPN
jgi:hypothetical protein